MIEKIIHGDNILAILMRSDYSNQGIEFFTPSNFSQQLGYINHSKGYVIPPHTHNQVSRQVHATNEVLFIKNGCIRVDFYDELQNYLESRILRKGDVILLASGGHGFEFLDNAEIVEVKQGPYAGEQDKTRFSPVDVKKVTLKNSESD